MNMTKEILLNALKRKASQAVSECKFHKGGDKLFLSGKLEDGILFRVEIEKEHASLDKSETKLDDTTLQKAVIDWAEELQVETLELRDGNLDLIEFWTINNGGGSFFVCQGGA
jgi:hypothetical protein